MKHIKIFEQYNIKLKYNVNDYVFLNLKAININNIQNGYADDTPDSPLAKIVEIDTNKHNSYYYRVEPAIPSNYTMLVKQTEILRKLNNQENRRIRTNNIS